MLLYNNFQHSKPMQYHSHTRAHVLTVVLDSCFLASRLIFSSGMFSLLAAHWFRNVNKPTHVTKIKSIFFSSIPMCVYVPFGEANAGRKKFFGNNLSS